MLIRHRTIISLTIAALLVMLAEWRYVARTVEADTRRQYESSTGEKQTSPTPTASEEWVYTHVKRGMSKDQVIRAVGEPEHKDRQDGDIETFYYFLAAPPTSGTTNGHVAFTGFQVLFQKDRAETIYPIYAQ